MSELPPSAVLRSLEAATAAHPLDRKRLVCRSVGEGRELLRAAAAGGASWLGWEVTTPRRLALERAAPGLAEAGLGVADAYDEAAAVDIALDRALEADGARGLRELGETPGFREAVANAIGALRLAGVDATRLRSTGAPNRSVRDLLAAVLEAYIAGLRSDSLVDTAEIMGRAARDLESVGGIDERTYLLSGLGLRGVSGRLVGALIREGAEVLAVDAVALPTPEGVLWRAEDRAAPLGRLLSDVPGPTPPLTGIDLDLFAASGPGEEIREVLRRVMSAGLRWDEVEIVATDPVVYGSALHGLAERLRIPVSYAVGLPVERTRAGRVVAAYLGWIRDGYPADVLRRLVEAGDLRPPGDGIPGRRLARTLRGLRVGWGHGRYMPALERAVGALDPPRPRGPETDREAAERVARERETLEALRAILEPILAATPRIDPFDDGAVTSPAAVATGLRAVLERVPAGDGPSQTARDRMLGIADRVAATLTRPTPPAAAIAALQRHLAIRVPAPSREGASPWISTGGYLHLTDLDHGGLTGRAVTFVVGLDAERVTGPGLQDPLLLDVQRTTLAPGALPTSADRLAARRFQLAALLARLRGRVTLSYAAWDPVEAREVAPSSALLQAYRALSGDAGASFEDLRDALGDAASAVPRTGILDTDDLWLDLLDHQGVLAHGEAAVRGVYAGLDRGRAADAARAGDAATPYHGRIRPRPDRLDPRRAPDLVLSASGLEDLGTCGLRWLFKYGLGVRPPDDPELDPDVWLGPLDRGRLLHSVYERALREAREAGIAAEDEAFLDHALDVLDREARMIQREVPPPGEAIRRRQMVELREDVRSFARMMAGTDDRWVDLELKFGLAGREPAVIDVKGGQLRLRGAIDRVDRVGERLRVIDYKTGGSDRFDRRNGTFHGGRRLQNVVYAAVAEALLDATVDGMEYHFPTRKGQNETISFRRDELRRGLGLVARLLDMVAAGRLLPTDDGADCRFCDYAPICRHRFDDWEGHTPMAAWGGSAIDSLPEYGELRDVRRWDDLFLAELDSDG